MKYLKKYQLFESSDFPTTKKRIKEICKEYDIKHYKINQDLSIDVGGPVDLSKKNLNKLPLRFNVVGGVFDCSLNYLTSLEGSPRYAVEFRCGHNNLTTLEGGPESTKSFDCKRNMLQNLKFAPKEVTYRFECDYNQITSLEFSPQKLDFLFSCIGNKLTSLEFSPRKVGSFICDSNLLTDLVGGPEIVERNFTCDNNKLTSLKGCPKIVKGKLRINGNNISDLSGHPKKISEIEVYRNPVQRIASIFGKEDFLKSLKYDYFAGDNKIRESKFVEACDELRVSAPDQIDGYIWV